MTAWRERDDRFDLPRDAVHTWIAALEIDDREARLCFDTLSIAERERAGRFRFPELQRHYVAAHGILRQILSGYLRTAPEALSFEVDGYGKPHLATHAGDIEFNLSHSDELASVAVTRGCAVGVDIESIKPTPDLAAISQSYFTPGERSFIESAGDANKERAFYVCWTRKEAYIKALGRGLSIPLPSFDASIPRDESGTFLGGRQDSTHDWWLCDLPPIDGHAGALVLERPVREYSYWRW